MQIMTTGRPRKTLAQLKASGTLGINPGRHKDRKEPKQAPLGKPPSHLSKPEVSAWHEMASVAYWLTAADRYHLERASTLLVKSRTKRGLDLKEDRFFMSVLKALCFGPSERHRIQTTDDADKEQDPAQKYFN